MKRGRRGDESPGFLRGYSDVWIVVGDGWDHLLVIVVVVVVVVVVKRYEQTAR